MVTCGPVTVIKSENIEDLKRAYKLTQAQLIESCEAHRELVDWWRRNNVN